MMPNPEWYETVGYKVQTSVEKGMVDLVCNDCPKTFFLVKDGSRISYGLKARILARLRSHSESHGVKKFFGSR